ncbi:PLP-dependent aminotransferase family protein [Pseudomonas sp. REP124]|uniref:MocR-like pyridoxine biosynthesis transcription factor PdxR n=1 Tax=Pseudomonas sp. REP124 TaxID=2875731 RepID=UPI001CCD8DEA|nr:PLP-dependent aminotransferase family protein [Pseudomonas sp. REP124]MBZ9780358.1 PLP-dependent aminotransferase family protein [Pseudomonas sp. REP124]
MGINLQEWLYVELRDAMLTGRIPPGSKLPGSRALAKHLGVARGTVHSAYQQLFSEGYTVSRTGSGTRVSVELPDTKLRAFSLDQGDGADVTVRRTPPVTDWLERLSATPAITRRKILPGLLPFFPMRSDVHSFPIDLWRKLHIQQMRSSKVETLLDYDPAGLPSLRRAIAQYLGSARGVHVPEDQIVVLSSVQQGIDLCLRLLARPGASVWMEDPGYPGVRQLMTVAGCKVVDVPVDQQGMRIEHGVQVAPEAELIYVTPSRQMPTSYQLSPYRRRALLRWANASGAYIIEDDYDSEYRFIAKPIPALRSMAGADDSVILAGTFSKLLFPSVRLAYLVLPPHLVNNFTQALALTSRHPNSLNQAVLAAFFDQGHFDRHVRRMRKLYSLRAEALNCAAQQHWRGLIEVPEIRGGLDIAASLLVGHETEACERMEKAGVDVMPLGRFYRSPKSGGFLLGFAPYEERAIQEAALKVRKALT